MSLQKGFYIYKTLDVVKILPVDGEDEIVFKNIKHYDVLDNSVILVNENGKIKEIPTI